MFSSALRSKRSGVALLASCVSATALYTTRARDRHSHSATPSVPVKERRVVVVGGGTGGLGVCAMLGNEGFTRVSCIEPKDVHYYQPIWSMVGAGVADNSVSVRHMKDIFPSSAEWIHSSAANIDPENNKVTLTDGTTVEYDYLVIAAGLEADWKGLPGLDEAINDPSSGVVSIYDYNYAEKTWETIRLFNKGRALFTMPTTPVKCPGAPQKIMWQFEELMRTRQVRGDVDIEWWVPGGAMFGVKKYSDMLEVLRKERDVVAHFKHVLQSIDGPSKVAVFKNLDTGEITNEKYDLLHVVPPLAPPAVVKSSPLAAASGFVEVDQYTLQSTKYSNVFALGDCTTTPNSKTAAAVTKQAPILVHNLQQVMEDKPANAKYNGYASCPLIMGKNHVILAEFGYGGKIMETFSRETGKFPYSLIGQEGAVQQRLFYWMKKDMFPYVYWNLWTKGKWFGNSGPFKPNVLEDDGATTAKK
jgi:NADPH-dependent 2,4-dienoyl-CoA reductase/sulfur reductase-like enzyme